MMDEGREVRLRERATRYDYVVRMTRENRTALLYQGQSHQNALSAYWQAVQIFVFLGTSGAVDLSLTLKRKPSGAFHTEVESGSATVLHKPQGNCRDWVSRGWTGDLAEKHIAHIPGTLGLPRDPDCDAFD